MKYTPYKDYDLYDMMHEPRRISKDPYKLHAAFMLSCLFEAKLEDDDPPTRSQNAWGWTVPVKVLTGICKNANEQFIDACKYGLQVDIWGVQYTIRHANDIDPSRLRYIFNFQKKEGDFIVSKDGIMDLANPIDEPRQSPIEEFRRDRDYLKKVVCVAEDDVNDGWYKLTDIETTMYLWFLYTQRHAKYDYESFREEFKDDLYTSYKDERACWNNKMLEGSTPTGPYIFSSEKVKHWNSEHNQRSIIDNVDMQTAENHWYST